MTKTTILLVEDEESFVEALTIGLQREDFEVRVARDGQEALDIFDDVLPDLVLLDVMLPRVLGARRLPSAPWAQSGADHHGEREAGRGRHGGWARGRC